MANLDRFNKENIRIRFEKFALPEPNSGCHLWVGSISNKGYGQFHCGFVDGVQKIWRAHRVAYALEFGDIPEGLDLDHLCRVRSCVNPLHLEPVTRSINLTRGIGGDIARAIKAKITHCPSGHEYSGNNLYLKGTRRYCRICRTAAYIRYRERRRGDYIV